MSNKITTGELVRQLGDEFVSFDSKTEIQAELKRRDAAARKNEARRSREAALRSCGLVKVRGELGGTYWE